MPVARQKTGTKRASPPKGRRRSAAPVRRAKSPHAKDAALAALRESEALFRRTVELAPSGIAHVGPADGRFLLVNRSLCRLLGYSEEELLARNVKSVSHPADRDITDAQRRRVHSGELESVAFEKRYLRKDGSVVWVDLTVSLVRGADGVPHHEIAIFDDATERKTAETALRESEQRFRSLTQVSSDWYWEQDEQFRFTMMSGGVKDAVGIAPEEFIGRTRWDRATGLSEAELDAHKVQLESHLPFTGLEYGRPGPDGRMRYISASGEPVFDEAGRFKGYRGVGRDVTERRTAQLALQAAHDELARSNAELEQFAYVASHDLQEPLRMVSSYTQLLGRRYGDKLDGDARDFMAFIVDGAGRMKQLIEDLLAYSRVGTHGREFKEVELESVLARAVVNLRGAIEDFGASITNDQLPLVHGDEMQLVQLFQNLIGNALKFRGSEAPHVHVSSRKALGGWEVSIADNGIGIEPQYFERIFLVFQRLHDKGQYPGTGIGLAICKKVVDRHGGRIRVESKPGKGSTFHFTLRDRQQGAAT
jgi:PAS domain S-box-containing protein